MKSLRSIAILAFCTGLLFGATSCTVFVAETRDQGNHRGWYKNPNNPHHPFTTNPGKFKGKSKRVKIHTAAIVYRQDAIGPNEKK